MYRFDIINALINKYNYQDYLEIGLDFADNYLNINCKNKECVDPYVYDYQQTDEQIYIRHFIEDRLLTYKMTSDEFFAKIPADKKYDIIFIDGLHTEEQVGRDIINSIKHLRKGGTIVVHDCLPEMYEAQLEERTMSMWNGSVWKAIPQLRFQGIDYITVDTDCGCCIIQTDVNPDNLYYPNKAEYDYHDIFDKMSIRNLIMNVISVDAFQTIFNNKQ